MGLLHVGRNFIMWSCESTKVAVANLYRDGVETDHRPICI